MDIFYVPLNFLYKWHHVIVPQRTFFFFNSPSNLVDSAILLMLSSDTVTSQDTYIGYRLHTYPRQALRLTTKQENLRLQCC